MTDFISSVGTVLFLLLLTAPVWGLMLGAALSTIEDEAEA